MSMLDFLEAPIADFLKVPSQPDPPIGAPESVRVFRASKSFFRYRLLSWVLSQVSAIVGIVAGFIFIGYFPDAWGAWATALELLGVGFYLLLLPFTYLLITLDYRYRWYVVTDRSLRIREGLWKVRERTMTYSNLQNLAVRQGPIQRFFGIADLEVRTAGGGSSGSSHDPKSIGDNLHVGYFRGVDNADEIREVIMAQMRSVRAAGLGDPDEPAAAVPEVAPSPPRDGGEPGLLAAAREVLSEARALRIEAGTGA